MVTILIGVLIAALVYWVCTAVGLPVIVAVIAAILVLVAAFGHLGYGRRRTGPPL